jgi:hypothetical protein
MGLFCRLCITFLAFDVVFVVICLAVACLVGIAVCCCLPCIITILYVVTDQVDKDESFIYIYIYISNLAYLSSAEYAICSYFGGHRLEFTWST